MKKIILILACIQILTISCSNDDDNSNDQRIIGKWNYYQEINEINGIDVGTYDWPHSCSNIKDNVEFVNDGNYIESYYLNNCQIDISNSGNGTWNLNGNNLTINIWGDVFTYQVVSVTDEYLKLKATDDIQPGDPDYFVIFSRN